jgi:hypothetical protein
VALDIAQLSALAAVFLSVVGVAAALFQSWLDRLRVFFARSVTAVVDMDDDAQSMVSAVARTLDRRSTLAVISNRMPRSPRRRRGPVAADGTSTRSLSRVVMTWAPA